MNSLERCMLVNIERGRDTADMAQFGAGKGLKGDIVLVGAGDGFNGNIASVSADSGFKGDITQVGAGNGFREVHCSTRCFMHGVDCVHQSDIVSGAERSIFRSERW